MAHMGTSTTTKRPTKWFGSDKGLEPNNKNYPASKDCVVTNTEAGLFEANTGTWVEISFRKIGWLDANNMTKFTF